MARHCEYCGALMSAAPPSEWSHVAPPAAVRARKPRWYRNPWLYFIGALALILAIVLPLVLIKSTAAYPDLVVGGKATLIDFFSDS
jgi:hypothetical protein